MFGVAGAVAYPISIACLVPWLWSRNKSVLDRLDSKYTPIWMKISARQSLFDDDDDDDEDDDDDDDKDSKDKVAKTMTAAKDQAKK